MVCTQLNYSFCDEGAGGAGNGACSAIGASECMKDPDPFDARFGWSKVPVVNGIPQFDPRQLPVNFNGKIAGGEAAAEITLKCEYKGTAE